MPRLKNKVPTYRLHKGTGQAVVTLNGRDVYLGIYDTDKSREAYQAAVNEWLAGQRRRPPSVSRETDGTPAENPTINEVFLDYWEFAQGHYRKYGRPTSEVASIKRALTPVLQLYGRRPCRAFGPLALKACRQKMIDDGLMTFPPEPYQSVS